MEKWEVITIVAAQLVGLLGLGTFMWKMQKGERDDVARLKDDTSSLRNDAAWINQDLVAVKKDVEWLVWHFKKSQ